MYESPPKADAFNRDTIFPFFRAINARYKFVMPGNTDFATNSTIYENEFTDPRFGLFEYIRHGVRYIDGKIGVLFSSYTNISPHSLKDSECVDVERDKVIPPGNSSHARMGTRQTTRVIVDYEECPRCGPNCICKVKEDIITTHRDIERHAKIKYVVAESLAVKGVISKEPDPNELSDDPSVEPIMLSDALAYSKKYFEVVDVMDPRTQPEWYRIQQQTTICTKMKATLLSLCGLYDKAGYMQGLNLPLEQIPEANNVKFVTNERIKKFDVVEWHNECCTELVGRSLEKRKLLSGQTPRTLQAQRCTCHYICGVACRLLLCSGQLTAPHSIPPLIDYDLETIVEVRDIEIFSISCLLSTCQTSKSAVISMRQLATEHSVHQRRSPKTAETSWLSSLVLVMKGLLSLSVSM